MTVRDASTILKMQFVSDTTFVLEGKVMAKAAMPHQGHGKHLCYLNNLGFQNSNLKEYKALVKDGKFLCKACGRVAVSQKSLCKPVRL